MTRFPVSLSLRSGEWRSRASREKRVGLLLFLLLSSACQVDLSTCTDGRLNGRETDLDCGGAQCAGCADGLVCLDDPDCASSVCTLNRCVGASCADGVQNGGETGVDCGGACSACPVQPSCTDGLLNGDETAPDCGGSCTRCLDGAECVRNTDCVTGVCSDGRCGGGAQCGPPLLACNSACVDSRFDPSNCGGCGVTCGAGFACLLGSCMPACGGGTLPCGGTCVAAASDPANCGMCGRSCAAGEICVGGSCFQPCPAGQAACGPVCAALDRDAQHCGMCDRACPSGSACVLGVCTPGCSAPLAVCTSGQCVDPRNDPDHCGGCDQACPPVTGAARACASNTCVTGPCMPGFENCNNLPADGCEADLGFDAQNCGGCNQPCNAGESCALGVCCGMPPAGSYSATCINCQACGGVLSCLCEDAMQVLVPTMIPLGCPTDYVNCNGVLTCGSC